MRLLLAAVTLVFASAGCSHSSQPAPSTSPAAAEKFTLTVAHINDTHSAFEPVDGHFYTDDLAIYNRWGGHPRLLARINHHRRSAATHERPFLVLHGGDAWQGSAYFKLNEGRMNADILSRMGIDAMALGNHEFDLNNALLNEFIASLSFPVLAANIDASQDEFLADQKNLKPYNLFSFAGSERRSIEAHELAAAQVAGDIVVAVFGLALEDMPNISPNVGDVVFHDSVASAQALVDRLEQKGVQHILALTHIGNAKDVRVAQQVNGIDAIIGGHSHSLLGDFNNLGLGQSDGPYAQRVINPNGVTFTCVVQAGEYAQAVGLLELSFDERGQVTDCGGGNTLLTEDQFFADSQRQQPLDDATNFNVLSYLGAQNNVAVVAEDTHLRRHIDMHYKPAMEQAYGAQLGNLPRVISHVRRPGDNGSSSHGSELAPLVATAQYAWASQPEVQAVTGLKPDFALLGAGGIRSALEEGELREGTISLEVLPFASPLSVVPLRGAVVRQVIAETITATLPQGAHAGRFPYGGMLRYEFVETVPGQSGELRRLDVNTGSIEQPKWQPLQDEHIYNVVINSYLASGNDGWSALATAQRQHSQRVDIALVNGELTAFPVERITAQDDGAARVDYAGEPLNCNAEGVHCNTDALAVIDYLRQRSATNDGLITPLSYPTVTLRRLMTR